MVFGGLRGSRFRHRPYRHGLAVLLPVALVLLWAPGASAANRIFWEDSGSNLISFANLDGSGHGGDLKTTGVTPNVPSGIAMDLLGGKIYWGDNGDNKISFAKLNDTGGGRHLKTTGASTPSGPTGVATDPATGKIYWGNINDSAVSFANLNDTGGGGDLSTSGATASGAAGVAVDPATGKIYWANAFANTISFANLDGSGGGDLDTTGATVSVPVGVAIDPTNGKIYWANANGAIPISFANLNDTGGGGDLSVGHATVDNPNGVAIDPERGKIYWANNGNSVFTISFAKLNGGGGGDLNTSGASALNDPVFPALLKRPLATARPKLSGGSKVGSRLSCSNGTWAPDLIESFLYQRPVSFSYAWNRNGKHISGATKKTLTASSAGKYTCSVTAKNQAGKAKNTSRAHTVKTLNRPYP